MISYTFPEHCADPMEVTSLPKISIDYKPETVATLWEKNINLIYRRWFWWRRWWPREIPKCAKFWEFITSFHIYTIYICLYTFLHNKTWDKWSKENMSQKHLYVKVYYSTILKTELWNNHNCKQMITLKMWLYAIQQKLFFQERTKKLHYSQKIQCNCRY